MQRSITFINVPAFPFAVERALSRKLRNRPLILARSTNPRTHCLSVSREASIYGIRRGMSIGDVRRYCRDVKVLCPNPPLYQRAVSAMQKIIGEYSPLVEPYRLGQSFIDLTGTERLFGGVESVTQSVRRRFVEELRLPAEAGIAVNKLVSRVAAFDASPEGLLQVDWGSEEPFLEPHRVTVLPAVDRDVRISLIELNVILIQQVKEIDLDLMLCALGPIAFSLSRQARGIDPEPVLPPSAPPRIVLAEELSEDTNDKETILRIVNRLVVEGTFRLQRRGSSTGELSLSVYYSDGQTVRGSVRLRKTTNSTAVWIRKACGLCERIITRRVRVRRIELIFSRLTATSRQLELWDQSALPENNGNPVNRLYRLDRAMNAVERIQSRFGSGSVSLGVAA